MRTSHLSDTEIQEYIIDRFAASDHIEDHFQECMACRAKAANYKLLFDELHSVEKPAFDFNLSELVLEQLPVKHSQKPWLSYLAIGLTVCLSMVTIIFFGKYLISVFKGLPLMLFYLIAVSGLCIVIFQCFEMLKVYQKQIHMLKSPGLLQH